MKLETITDDCRSWPTVLSDLVAALFPFAILGCAEVSQTLACSRTVNANDVENASRFM
ncbi:MAG: hypothetical protein AAF671_07370 [Pseudomonadota bacterium]